MYNKIRLDFVLLHSYHGTIAQVLAHLVTMAEISHLCPTEK